MSLIEEYYGSIASFQNNWSDNLDGGSEFVSVADDAVFSFGDNAGAGGTDVAHTKALWIKPDTINLALQGLISKSSSVLAAKEYYSFMFNGGVRSIYEDRFSGGWIGRNTASGLMTAGNWYHIIMMYTASKTSAGVSIFINDVQVDNANNQSLPYNGMSNTTSNLTFGAINTAGGGPFDGRIFGEIIITGNLDAAERTELYNLKSGDPSSLSFAARIIGAWHFPNGQADYPTLTDDIAGRNGTMQNQENLDINNDVPV